MGKTGKWLKNFLVGTKKPINKDKVSVPSAAQTPTTPKEKKRWSFRRSSVTPPAAPAKGLTFLEESNSGGGGNALLSASELESEQKKHALAVAAATAAAADAAAAAAQAAAAVVRLTAATASRTNPFEEEAAVKIQSAFRSYLARKALSALRGLVKLQALIRGHLVRKQATATLRCMEALVTVQARARVQRQLRMVEESKNFNSRPWTPRKSTRYDRFRHVNHEVEADKGMEETIKIVEMDPAGYSNHRAEQVSPAPSALTDLSPRTCSGRFEDYNNYLGVTQSSPQCYSAQPRLEPTRVPFATYTYADSTSSESYPNYMANTESSRAKVRSQSAPKQRAPEYLERPPSSSRRRPSVEGRNVNNVPRFGRMQRSSSHVGSGVQNYRKPWSIKLDKSSVSLKDSECGSNSTVLTDINYCRSLVNYSMNGRKNKTLPPFPLAHAV